MTDWIHRLMTVKTNSNSTLILDTTTYTMHAPGTALIYNISSKNKKVCTNSHEFIKYFHIQAALLVVWCDSERDISKAMSYLLIY